VEAARRKSEEKGEAIVETVARKRAHVSGSWVQPTWKKPEGA